MRYFRTAVLALLLLLQPLPVAAKEKAEGDIYKERMDLYKKTEAASGVPWYYLAAVDQYERSIRHVRKDLPKPGPLTGFYIRPEEWAGLLNPDLNDLSPETIGLFGGSGLDGNGDGKADAADPEDLLYALADSLASFGVDDTRFRLALWEKYKRDKTVGAIFGNALVYRTFGRIDLDEKAFPLPLHANYSYRSTWGDKRGWGGRRIHEGTDLFAGYGVPVRAVGYGVIELKGWNRFGGWRVGIRDLNNTYHYYAHLNGFAKGLSVGDVVEPGMVIGSVGSSGYGPPGTAGKFPPHLHFGMYKDDGRKEWAFDPYPHLRQWERNSKK